MAQMQIITGVERRRRWREEEKRRIVEAAFAPATPVVCSIHRMLTIERKVNALDQAAPLADWILPPIFLTLRHLLEGRMGKAGKREYVQVLRLLENFPLPDVDAAIQQAVQLGAIGFDAVKHVLLCRIEKKPPRLNLEIYPYLPRAQVNVTRASSYFTLLAGGTA